LPADAVHAAQVAAAASMTASFVAGGVAIAVAVWNAFMARRLERERAQMLAELEQIKAEIALASGEATARRTYEFEARKRLYAEAEPLLFQFYENAMSALNRLTNMARSARSGELADWLENPDGYYLRSCLHSLLTPLANIHLLRTRLTAFDLSLDPAIERQYAIGKALNRSFARHVDFAMLAPALDYRPDEEEVGKQGLYSGEIQQALAVMLTGPAEAQRLKTFGEFVHGLDTNPTDREDVRPFVALLRDFEPRRRPVLWRILMTQLFLYRAARLYRQRPATAEELIAATTLKETERQQYAFSHAPEDQLEVEAGYRIGQDYLKDILRYAEPYHG
jgi:hypothetical protein